MNRNSLREFSQSLDCISTDRAGIQSLDGKRAVGHEEYVCIQLVQVLQNLQKYDVFRHQNVMERLNIFVAVLDGYAIAEADAFYLVVTEPGGALGVDQEPLVLVCVGFLRKGRNPVGGINDYNIAFFDLAGSGTVKVCCRDMGARSYRILKVYVDSSSKEGGQWQVCHAWPVIVMVVGAFTVGSQMAGQIHDGVKIRNRAAGIETGQMATAGFSLRIQDLGQIDDSQIS